MVDSVFHCAIDADIMTIITVTWSLFNTSNEMAECRSSH